MIRVLFCAALAILAAGGAGYACGRHVGGATVQARWDADSTAQTLAVTLAVQRAGDIAQSVITRFLDSAANIHAAGKTIIEKVPVYVTAKTDAHCVVPRGFVRVHNAAATGASLPSAAASTVSAPSGVALSAVARVVSTNYTSCRITAARLIALQGWALKVSEAMQ